MEYARFTTYYLPIQHPERTKELGGRVTIDHTDNHTAKDPNNQEATAPEPTVGGGLGCERSVNGDNIFGEEHEEAL